MAIPKRLIRRVKILSQYLFIIGLFFLVLVFLDSKFGVLPQSIHDHLPTHHDGLVMTDLTIQTCSRLNPFSTCRLDPTQWYRIEKDLYLGNQWTSQAYLHTKRKREEELDESDSVILDVRISRLDPSKVDHTDRKEKAHASQETWESRSNGVWILRSSRRHESDSDKAITAIDVLFGADAAEPRLGWTMSTTPLLLDDGGHGTEAHISLRHGPSQKLTRAIPRIRRDGKFKIVQLADLHLATGLGHCRDAEPAGEPCEADQRTLDFVRRILDDEVPDLVILSGDQVNGDTAPDAQSAIFKISEILSNRPTPIPYAAIFGNHDDENTPLSRAAQMHLLESLPYSLSRAGPTDIDGVGNYYVEVLASGSSHHSAMTIYLLDTHSYSPDEKHYHGYDWLKENQIAWFRETAKSLKPKHHNYAKLHMDMAFIHIPLPEYREDKNHFVGEWREGVTAPYFNTHFKDALVEAGVLAVSCGHDHVNSYCMLSEDEKTNDPELWMCYGGGAGFGGYGGYGGYHRRLRVFEVDTNEARIHTWKRMEWGSAEELKKRVDEQIIVSGGRVVNRRPS